VTVDRHYDIQSINNAARRLLGIHGSAIGEDFVHLAEGLRSAELRQAIDQAFRGEDSTMVWRVGGNLAAVSGSDRYVEVSFSAQSTGPNAIKQEIVVVTISDCSETVQEREQRQALARGAAEERARLGERLAALEARATQLVEANQDLASTNAELRNANEELIVANEEVQAATEEVETLNEELQATNEELETLNEELQATIEELNTPNDDLEARSVELQDLATSLEEQRLNSEAARLRLEAVLGSMADAVMVVDPSGRSLLTNAAFDRQFGGVKFIPVTETGAPIPPDETPQSRAARGEMFRLDFALQDGDERRHYEASGQPIQVGAPERGGVVVFRDVTDRSLRYLQEQLMSFATHELRTPLTALGGYLEILERKLPDTENAKRLLGQARTQVDRVAGLVAELVDLTRLQTGKLNLTLAPVDLKSVAVRSVEIAQALARGQTLHLSTPVEPVEVQADDRRLEQVLFNLLTNAIKYAPGTDRIDVRVGVEGNEAVLEVHDEGPGISAEDRAQIFTRLYQAASRNAGEGLGLGLYISHEIVAAHGGTISVTSTPGHGATFTVRLPLQSQEAPSDA
jgi:two-component system CheB/CheR fusion protein